MSVQCLSFVKGIAASICYLFKLAKKISWNCAMVRCTAGQALILFRYFTQIDFWTCTGNKIDDRSHGLRTLNEAFFHWNPELLAWDDKFWGIFDKLSASILLVSPLSMFSIIQQLFLQKTKPLYPTKAVQRDTLVQQFVQKCQYYYTLSDQSIPLVTVRSNVSLLTEQLWFCIALK